MQLKTVAILGLSVIVLALGGLYYVTQYLPEVDADSANGPVETLDRTSASRMLPLTTALKNPAGLSYVNDKGTWLVSTDDRIIAELSADFSTILFATKLANNPNAIGDTEGIAYLGAERAAVTGENGVVIMMRRKNGDWIETERFPITGFVTGTQLGSAAYDGRTNRLYTAQKTGEKRLYVIDLETRKSQRIQMRLHDRLVEKEGRSWREFTIAGLHFHNGKLYAISEAYSSILVIEPSGRVSRIIAVENINESAGIAISGRAIMLIGDAENYLPDPPVYVIERGDLSS